VGDQKIKAAGTKVPLNLLPLRVLKGVARVFGYGAKKYAKGNWYTASDDEFADRYVGGALRHLSDAQNPDGTFDFASLAALDKESGLPEIDHLLCGLIMLRGLATKRGILPEDPGVGNDPPVPEARPLRAWEKAVRAKLETAFVPCECRECEAIRTQTTCDLSLLGGRGC
jgi:hypothetical protein